MPASGTAPPIKAYRTLFDSSHSSFQLCRCSVCRQPYLRQFHEIVDWGGGPDDVCIRWMPLAPGELEEIAGAVGKDRPAEGLWNWLAKLIRRRPRLVEEADGRMHWSEDTVDNCDLMPPG